MRRNTQQEVEANLKIMGFKLLSPYVNTHTKLKLQHIKCGFVFDDRSYNHIRKNSKCPKCYPQKTVRMSIERIKKIVEKKNEHRLLSTQYTNNRTPIEIECLISGQKVTTTLKSYMNSKGCKACWGLRNRKIARKKRDQKLKEINEAMFLEGYILRTKEYRDNKKPLAFTCPKGHKGQISWNNFSNGARCRQCKYEDMTREGNVFWKGGLFSRNLASYETYALRLEKYDIIRPDPDEPEILQVACTLCRKWYRPKRNAIKSRIEAIAADDYSENRLYCSEECKKKCEVYRKSPFQCSICGVWFLGKSFQKYCSDCSPYAETFPQATKDYIYERDIKLGRIDPKCNYSIHHILPKSEFPSYAKEVWNGITVDLDRHSMIHNACLVARVNFAEVDPSYFDFAVSTLKENNAPKEIVDFCINLYENR